MNSSKVVIVKLKGGMGNQMFQYAFGRALEVSAKNAGKPITLLFDTTAYTNPLKKDTRRPYMLADLNTHAAIASDTIALKARNPYGIISKIIRRVMQELHTGNTVAFDPTLFTPPYKKYYEGYWQSEKYFVAMAEQMRQEFTLKNSLGTVATAAYERIATDPNAVSIFYRRTDYVGHKTFDIGEQDYQRRAIACMRELVPDLRLYVMSDDITWVEKNADLPKGSVFVSSKDIPPHEEMRLASACKHNIIPNSTFAWWGAWLNQNAEKIVIAPKNWMRDASDQYKDITPENWLRV